MSNDRYFQDHYRHINGVDPSSAESMQRWLEATSLGNHREIGPHLPDLAGKRILELGCGIGGTLNYLKQRGAVDITGVDLSDDQLDICRRYVTTNVVTSDAIEFLRNDGPA